jgi:hypothetical protein
MWLLLLLLLILLLLLLQGCAAVFCNGNFQVDPSWVSGPPPKSADMVVCHYAPPGNMVDGGQEVYFQQNVSHQASTS